jgi:hypothetical protein
MKMTEMKPGQFARITGCQGLSNPGFMLGDVVLRLWRSDVWVVVARGCDSSLNAFEGTDFYASSAQYYEVEVASSYAGLRAKVTELEADLSHAQDELQNNWETIDRLSNEENDK